MITTAYGTFLNATGVLSPAVLVEDYLANGDTEWCEQMKASGAADAITEDFTDAINEALPDNIWVSGSEIIGPYHTEPEYDEEFTLDTILDIVNSIDLEEIVERHEKAAAEAAMKTITDAVDARTAAAEKLDAAEEAVADAVRAALKLENPATAVAKLLGVTRARVYQIRDGRR